MKARSLDELAALRDALRQQKAEAARARVAEEAERQCREHARDAFAHAVGPVQRLADAGRVHGHAPRPEPLPRQREADERAALREALSDEVDIDSLLLTDDGLSFRRPGVAPDVVSRLRRGQWSIQAQIDVGSPGTELEFAL